MSLAAPVEKCSAPVRCRGDAPGAARLLTSASGRVAGKAGAPGRLGSGRPGAVSASPRGGGASMHTHDEQQKIADWVHDLRRPPGGS
jgi:hypothetical protein